MGYVPQISLAAQATYQSDVTAFPDTFNDLLAIAGVDMEGLSKDQYKVQLNISQTIWDGGYSKAQREAVKAQQEVSKLTLDKDMEALNEQLHAVDEFAKAQGVEISNIFSDFGSGVRFSNREEFCNLMDECAAGKIKTIYVADEKCIATIDPQFIIAFLRVQFQVDVVSMNAEVIVPLYEVRYEGDIAKRGRYD